MLSNIKININGGLLTYVGWFLSTLPAVIFVGPYGIGFIKLFDWIFKNPSGQTAETFFASVLLVTMAFVVSLIIYQAIILTLCPILVSLLLQDYPGRRIRTVLCLELFIFFSPVWLLLGSLSSWQPLGILLATVWSIISPYIAWKLSSMANA